MNTNEIIIDDLKYQTYNEYIDSGIEWLGKIPSHYKFERIKNKFNVYTGNSIKDEKREFYIDNVNGLNFIATKDISNFKINYDSEIKIPKEHNFKKLEKYTPLLCIEGGSAGKKIAITNQEIHFGNKLCSFNNKSIVLKKYFYYYLQSYPFQSQFNNELSGMIEGVSIGIIKRLYNILPSKKEQLSIVKFLDNKIDTIDKKISILERRNTLINELEQSIINQCVTKGVDSFTKLDKNGNLIDFENKLNRNKEEFDLYMNENGYIDSEIEWLGFFPKNFNKKRLKELATFRRGSFPQPYDNEDFYDDINGKPFVQVGDVDNNHQLKNKTKQMISKKAEPYSVFVSKGNLIMTIQGSIGKIAITQYDAYIDRTLLIFKSIKNNIDKKFLVYFLEKLFFEEKKQAIGGTILTINKEKLSQFFICFPSKKEQLEIVKFLDNKTQILEQKRIKREKEITLLEEYKKTLINDVVTGKIKVIKD